MQSLSFIGSIMTFDALIKSNETGAQYCSLIWAILKNLTKNLGLFHVLGKLTFYAQAFELLIS